MVIISNIYILFILAILYYGTQQLKLTKNLSMTSIPYSFHVALISQVNWQYNRTESLAKFLNQAIIPPMHRILLKPNVTTDM
jgi:hypothetical protein